jgi:hypothetical protein
MIVKEAVPDCVVSSTLVAVIVAVAFVVTAGD